MVAEPRRWQWKTRGNRCTRTGRRRPWTKRRANTRKSTWTRRRSNTWRSTWTEIKYVVDYEVREGSAVQNGVCWSAQYWTTWQLRRWRGEMARVGFWYENLLHYGSDGRCDSADKSWRPRWIIWSRAIESHWRADFGFQHAILFLGCDVQGKGVTGDTNRACWTWYWSMDAFSRRYDRRDEMTQMGSPPLILSYSCGDQMENVLDKLRDFDAILHRYAVTSGTEFQDSIVRAVLTKTCPEPLRTHLQVDASTFRNAQNLKSAIREYL